ncbi:myeloid leukemia factor 1-like [Condylostylus longicornis]|uniref:myeloid leukemia factor 1-like n=1 Tax=Condylostylus longicornis TaxID=2530218 RepID=UPI00244DF426|nr:myeloid leukemia factor 1-like [Condylostylus longicornis]
MVMSSTVGPDGRSHVEKYAKSTSGNTQHRIRETKEAYSNSADGIDRLLWERQLQDRGRRFVQEKNRGTGEVVSNDEIAGMSRDDECEIFDTDWNRAARQHLPIRSGSSLMQFGDHEGRFSTTRQQPRQIEAADVSDRPSRRSHRSSHGQRYA